MKRILLLIFIFFLFPLKVFSSEPIKIAFVIDNNYPVFTMIAMESVLQNNLSKSNYKFFVIENNLSKFNKFQMEKFVKSRNQEIEFININPDIFDKGKDYYKIPKKTEEKNVLRHVTKIAELRLYLPEILKNENKILYLDGDIIVTADLKNLWETDLEQYPIGMGSDIFKYMKKAQNKIPDEYKGYKYDKYYNAGVMLMDLDKMRKEGWDKKLTEDFHNHPEYHFHDQDAINNVMHDNIKPLPEKWNMAVDHDWPLGKYATKRGIYHFIGKWKPWKFNPRTYYIKNYKSYQKLYLKYWEKSYLKIYIPYYIFKALPKLYFGTIDEEIMRMKYWN